MNLYIRVLLFFLSLPFIKKVKFDGPTDFNYKSIMPLRVWPTDLDIFNHMNNGRYLSIMDFGRFHLMAQFGTLKKAHKNGWSPVVGGIKITYLRSLKLLNKYKLTTQLVCWDEKWVFMEQQFIRVNKHKKEELMATALIKALFVKGSQKVPSKELISVFFPDGLISPPMPLRIQKWLEGEK